MTDSPRCPQCNRQIPVDAPDGLCPDCLLAHAVPSLPSDATPSRARTPAPAVAALDGLFPQLEVLELIGQGGMGAVYKARQIKLDRLVALKIIRSEAAENPAFAERFGREARTLARLNHPGIVGIYDFGDVTLSASTATEASADHSEGTPLYYFVMEYVDGVNLRELFAEGALPADQALAIVPQLCEALQYAHQEGVVHRDIKPENILLDPRGRVKIADFGLAKIAAPSGVDFTLTATHQVMGTPRYMAPEQMEGSRTVDHRADIYSLGVVFYEMLTGQVPAGHFEPPSRHTAVDPRLDEIVLRALARDPAHRYQQVSELSRHVNALHEPGRGNRGIVSRGSEAPWPGPSTILEQGVDRIVRGVREGEIHRGAVAAATPSVVAILLCLMGLGTMLLPWAIRTTGKFPAAGPPVYAWDNAWGQLAGIVLFGLALALFAGTPSGRRPAWRPWTLLICGGLLFGLGALFHENELKGAPLISLEGVFGGDSTAGSSAHGERTIRNVPQTSFRLVLAVSIGLMLIGAWDMRQWVNTPVANTSAELRSGGHRTRNAIAVASLSYALLTGFIFLATTGLTIDPPESDFVASLVIAALLWLPAAFVMGRRWWRRVNGGADDRPADKLPTIRPTPAVRDSQFGGRDWVVLSREQVDTDDLPDVCIVCGRPTLDRVNRDFSFQPAWAQLLTLLGMFLFVIPGLVAFELTSRHLRVACPVCPQHRNHWSRFTWWASLGWLIPVALGGMATLLGSAMKPPGGGDLELATGVAGVILGLVAYIVPMIWIGTHLVDAEEITDSSIRLRRVSAEFARLASGQRLSHSQNTPESPAVPS